MKTIKLGNKDYNIPENWHEVNVGMLIKASELAELLEEAPIIAITSAYTGIPVKEIKSNDVPLINEILSIMAFISTPYKPQPKTEFELLGVTYACSDDLTKQRFEDFVSIQTALYNHRDEPERALAKLLAIYCKRENETLDDFDLDERSQIMNQLPMTTAKDIEAFFLHSLVSYKAVSQLSSTIDIQRELVLHKVAELENTMKQSKAATGGFSLMRLRIGISQLYLRYFKTVLVRYFNSWDSKPSKKISKPIYKRLLSKIQRKNIKL